jgi:hypothetical protein
LALHRALNGLVALLLRLKPDRIVITGGPRRGKSTVARKLATDGRRYHHGEELKRYGLGPEGSQKASEWLDEPGRFVCENVIMARALRKWMARNPTGKPADIVVNLQHAVADTIPGQDRMAVGCETTFREILPELLRRGVRVIQARE